MSVAAGQRFTEARRCPICGGHDELPKGERQRCWGFLSDDGDWAHCTREEFAGGIAAKGTSKTYAHRLVGDCNCGKPHGGGFPSLASASTAKRRDREIVETFPYVDTSGELVYEAVRYGPKGFSLRRPDPDHGGKYIWNMKGIQRVPYRLPALIAAVAAGQTVYIVEGERLVHELERLDRVATCNSEGAGCWKDYFAESLRGAEVVIIADCDVAGREHAIKVAMNLDGVASRVRVADPAPDRSDGHDIKDVLQDLDVTDALTALSAVVDTAIEMSVPGGSTPANQSPAALVARASRVTQNNGTPRENPIERALKIVDDRRIALAHDGFDAYLIVRQEAGGIRAIPVASIVFRQWLSKVHVAAGKLPPRGETVGIVRDLLEVEAREANETIRAAPGIRVARDDRDGSVLLDLGQPERTAIRITADGWSDPEPHPLDGPYTYRPPQFGALPTPQRDGDINELWKYVNIEDDGTRALVIAWAVQAILPSPVYPIMGVYGPQGSTKTTAQRILLSLCDPAAGNDMQLGKRPKDEGALMAQAKARRVLTFDNLSQIEPWFSDALCCLATGALIEARTLYSNFDLSTFAARRPIMLNGIPNVAEHGDLADRSLRVDC